jgi:hypothetical protein
MTHSVLGPASSSGKARVLLSPDGKQVALAIPQGRTADPEVRWFVLDAESIGVERLAAWGATTTEVREWIPVVGVNELHEHIEHWRATAAGRSGECSDRVVPGICCFPEGVATAVSDVEDLIMKTEEETWQA